MWLWTGSRARSLSSSSGRGFTLIEVLVAFAIMALTLAALLQVFTTGLRSVDLADRHLMATMLARSVLDDVGSEIPLVAGEQSAEIEQGYRWTVRIQPASAIAPVTDIEWTAMLYEVQVEVAWNDRPVTTLKTLRLLTEQAAASDGTGEGLPRQ
jgi:general secretion pathway protein I